LAMDTEGLLYGSVSVRLTPPDSAKAWGFQKACYTERCKWDTVN
jgi:hypothetical protein